MDLVGRLRAARPLHAERKTRPLHRERHRAKEGQEMRPQSNPERQNCVKKMRLPPAPIPGETFTCILLGKMGQDKSPTVI